MKLSMLSFLLAMLLTALSTLSYADQICFEWSEYVQSEVIADKFIIYQSGDIYIDNIAVDSTRECTEIAQGDKSCHNYWVQAWTGNSGSEIDPNGVMYHCFGGRPGGHSGFLIIQVRGNNE